MIFDSWRSSVYARGANVSALVLQSVSGSCLETLVSSPTHILCCRSKSRTVTADRSVLPAFDDPDDGGMRSCITDREILM